VKKVSLLTLGSPISEIRNASCTILSAVALIELPRKEVLFFIYFLCI